MTNFVKGYVEPELNLGQRSLLELFLEQENESEDWRQPTRIDKVEVVDEQSIHIYTSQFIDLEPNIGSVPHRHLQVMTVHLYYQPGDPYDDIPSITYREVLLTNVYRTFINDPGWINSLSSEEYLPDVSDLHTDWL
jgi:hypothetical protein